MSADVVALDPVAKTTEGKLVGLRREAVDAVARQQRLRQELALFRARARGIERRATRALGRGEEIAGRQILARGMFTLKTREALEAALAESRGHVARLLATMVRAENRRRESG